jgi:hypothetical protein
MKKVEVWFETVYPYPVSLQQDSTMLRLYKQLGYTFISPELINSETKPPVQVDLGFIIYTLYMNMIENYIYPGNQKLVNIKIKGPDSHIINSILQRMAAKQVVEIEEMYLLTQLFLKPGAKIVAECETNVELDLMEFLNQLILKCMEAQLLPVGLIAAVMCKP